MDVGTALVAIAGIGAFYSLKHARIRHGGDLRGWRGRDRHGAPPAADPALPSPREEELKREVEELRERIHVLERIATDTHKPRALAAEIESLRDH